METKFNIIHNTSFSVIESFDSLKDCLNYIRLSLNYINNFSVDQIQDGVIIDTIAAKNFLEIN